MRLLIKLLVTLTIITLLILSVLWVNRVSLIRASMTKALETPVDLQAIHLSKNSISIEGLEIHTPEGSKLDHAFRVDTILIEASPLTLLERRVEIHNIIIESPEVGIEVYSADGRDNNWSRLLKSLEPKDQIIDSTDKKASDREFFIHHLEINDIQVKAYNPFISDKILAPRKMNFEMDDISSHHKQGYRELSLLIFRALMKEVIQKRGLEGLLKNLKFPGKGLIERGSKELKSIIPGMHSEKEEGEKKSLKDSLKNFFRK